MKLGSYSSSQLRDTLEDQEETLKTFQSKLVILTSLKEKQKPLLRSLLTYLSKIKTKILMFLKEEKCLSEARPT